MTATSISSPYQIFTDVDGLPLESGYIYIGVANQNPEVNPLQVFWDEAATIPAAQPVRTLGGYPIMDGSPGNIYVDSATYSITIKNKNGSLVYTSLSSSGFINVISGSGGADLIGFSRSALTDQITTVGQMLSGQDVNIYEYADLVTVRPSSDPDSWDWYPAIQAAINAAPARIRFPGDGIYTVGAKLSFSGVRGLTMYGDGHGEIAGDAGTANIKLGYDGVLFEIDGIGVTTYFGITFENLRIIGDASGSRTAGTAISIINLARRVYIKNCHIVDFFDYGIYVNSAGGLHIYDTDVFNCGYNIYGNTLADTTIYGGQSGSGAGGGAAWVIDNIYMLGAGGNTHFINHRPNFSSGVGVRIGGNVTRCSFVGGLCDNNIGHGFVLEDNCTAIKIQGMDIFDNGTTTSTKSGIVITSDQFATGFQGPAGIQIIGNNIFDRDQGTANEVMSVGIDLSSLSKTSAGRVAIVGNGLERLTTKISMLAGVPITASELSSNTGIVTTTSGITASVATDAVGAISINGIDVSALTEDLHNDSLIILEYNTPTALDFSGSLFAINATSGTTFDIRLYIISASATGGSTVKVKWTVYN